MGKTKPPSRQPQAAIDLIDCAGASIIYRELARLFESPKKAIEEMRAAVASGEVRSVSIDDLIDSLYFDRHEAKYKERKIDAKPTLNTVEFWRKHRFYGDGPDVVGLAEQEDDGTWTDRLLRILLLRRDAAVQWPGLERSLMWPLRFGRTPPQKRQHKRGKPNKGGRPPRDWTSERKWTAEWLADYMAAGNDLPDQESLATTIRDGYCTGHEHKPSVRALKDNVAIPLWRAWKAKQRKTGRRKKT